MIKIKFIRNLLLPALLIAFIFTGCQSRKVNWNKDIPANLKNEIKTCNDSILGAIAANNPSGIKYFFSDTLVAQSGADFENTVSKMNELIKTADYHVFDECYVKNPAPGLRDTIVKKNPGDGSYKINFDAAAETYVSLLLHETEDGQLLITCIYQKQRDRWKLYAFRIGRYSIFGSTAIDIYHQAKDKFENGAVIDAADLVTLINQPLKPAFQFFQYEKENEILSFAEKVKMAADTTFRFPNLISELKSEPTIYSIQPLPAKEGIFPLVTYGTQIHIPDAHALKNENDDLQKIIGQLFPGMEKNKYVFFKVYQLTSSGQLNKTEHAEFIMHGTVNQP
jgi:hypothetical protein